MSIALAHAHLGTTSPSKYFADSDQLLKQHRNNQPYSITPSSSCGDSSRDSLDAKSSSVSPELQHHHYLQYSRNVPVSCPSDVRRNNIYSNDHINNSNHHNMPSAFGSLDGPEVNLAFHHFKVKHSLQYTFVFVGANIFSILKRVIFSSFLSKTHFASFSARVLQHIFLRNIPLGGINIFINLQEDTFYNIFRYLVPTSFQSKLFQNILFCLIVSIWTRIIAFLFIRSMTNAIGYHSWTILKPFPL